MRLPGIAFAMVAGFTLVAAGAEGDDPGIGAGYTKDAYPSALVDRPLTLPARTLEVQPGLIAASDQFATLDLAFGVTDRLELDLSGLLCVSSSCMGVRQAGGAALGYAFVSNAKVNLVGALTFAATHTLNGSSAGPGVALAFADRFSNWFELLIEGGTSHATGNRGVVAPYSDTAFGFFGRVEPRFQITRRLALAPFVGFTVWLGNGASAYALPVGVRALISAASRLDVGLQLEASDLTASSTLVNYSVDFAGYVAIRL